MTDVAGLPWTDSDRPTTGATGGEPGPAGQHLVDVHDHFRGELERLRNLLEQVRAGLATVGDARSELNAMTLRSNSWVLGSVCQSYCLTLTQHHTLEDAAVFPHLAQRLGSQDRGLADVLDRLGREHRAIHDLLESLDAALVALVSEPDAIDRLDDALTVLGEALLSHFAYEERELAPALDSVGYY